MRAVAGGGLWIPLAPTSRLLFSWRGLGWSYDVPSRLGGSLQLGLSYVWRGWQSAVLTRQRKDDKAWGQKISPIASFSALCIQVKPRACSKSCAPKKPPLCVHCSVPVHTCWFLRMVNGPGGCGKPVDRQGSRGGWLCLLGPPVPIPTVGC